MQIEFRAYDLSLRHSWTVANGMTGLPKIAQVVFVRLTHDGIVGLGEATPSLRYSQDRTKSIRFLSSVDPAQLSFEDIPASMAQLDRLSDGYAAMKAALNMALLDGAAQLARKPLYDFLELGFTEGRHYTSFTIGLDQPERIHAKVLEAAPFPILKLKLGSRDDRKNLGALRAAAPGKRVRVDANEAWKNPAEALRNIEWLATDPHIEFVEQPMSASRPIDDFIWLKERSPLPIFADESCRGLQEIDQCAAGFHGVNIKLTKTGGITSASRILKAARAAGLKTMIGCMVESSIASTAAAHLAELADYLDIDGNLLVTNDPCRGITTVGGLISFDNAPEPFGLRVAGWPKQ